MASTSNGEIPLILNDPRITEEMKGLITIIEQIQGKIGRKICGLRKGENGEWVGVFRED